MAQPSTRAVRVCQMLPSAVQDRFLVRVMEPHSMELPSLLENVSGEMPVARIVALDDDRVTL